MEKLIITAAICGAEVTKEQNPAVPYTVEEMVREAKSAYEAGAAILHIHVREDDVELFGFHDRQELGCFKLLLGVSGVGPKVSLSILSDIDPNNFALAVATGNHKLLTKTKGVGPKMAQRIVLELKDKISKEQMSFAESSAPAAVNRVLISGGAAGEALDALLVLGYSQAEAESAVSKLDPALSAEELIRQALKSLAKF